MFLIRIKLLYLIFNFLCHGSLDVDVYRHFCPYTRFCTDKSAIRNGTIFSKDQIPCCFPCFCDQQCWLFSDCCPDARRPKNIDLYSKASCQFSHYLSEEFRTKFTHLHFAAKYIIQDKCPFNSTGPDADKCAEIFEDTPSLEDISVVSDSKHLSRVYKNKYCAECHGVKNITRWNAVTGVCTTRPMFAEWNITHSEPWEYILSRCAIQFTPPPTVPTRSVYCSSLVPETRCENGTVHLGLDVHQACMDSRMPLFHHNAFPMSIQYSNLFCYLCDTFAVDPKDTVCRVSMFGGGDRHPSAFVMLDIKPGDFKVSESTTVAGDITRRCKDEEIYDEISKMCRRLHCPSYAPLSRRQCVQIGKVVPGMAVSFYMALVVNSPVNTTIDFVRPRELYRLERTIRIRSKILACPLQIQEVRKFTPKQPSYPECLGVLIYRTITKGCPFEFLVNQLTDTLSASWKQKMLLGNLSVHVSAGVKFYPKFLTIYRNEVDDYSNVLLFAGKREAGISGVPVSLEMFRCPHVLLNMSEYNSSMTTRILNKNTLLTKMTISTLLYKGFHVVGKDEIAVCSETFLELMSSAASSLNVEIVLLIVTIFCSYLHNSDN